MRGRKWPLDSLLDTDDGSCGGGSGPLKWKIAPHDGVNDGDGDGD